MRGITATPAAPRLSPRPRMTTECDLCIQTSHSIRARPLGAPAHQTNAHPTVRYWKNAVDICMRIVNSPPYRHMRRCYGLSEFLVSGEHAALFRMSNWLWMFPGWLNSFLFNQIGLDGQKVNLNNGEFLLNFNLLIEHLKTKYVTYLDQINVITVKRWSLA